MSKLAGSILDSVDQRTQLVGENRLEILMFRLSGRQLFAINVFKVQEVVRLPALTRIPQRHPHVIGVVNLRGKPSLWWTWPRLSVCVRRWLMNIAPLS